MDNNGNVPSQVEELTCTLKVNDINDEIPQFSGQNPQVTSNLKSSSFF